MGHRHEHQDSGKVEYYTPLQVVACVRQALGAIDLDPASCETANKIVQADRIFTREDNGLAQEWHGRIHYLDENLRVVKGANKGSVITYLGDDVGRFAQAFEHLGTIKIPYRSRA